MGGGRNRILALTRSSIPTDLGRGGWLEVDRHHDSAGGRDMAESGYFRAEPIVSVDGTANGAILSRSCRANSSPRCSVQVQSNPHVHPEPASETMLLNGGISGLEVGSAARSADGNSAEETMRTGGRSGPRCAGEVRCGDRSRRRYLYCVVGEDWQQSRERFCGT